MYSAGDVTKKEKEYSVIGKPLPQIYAGEAVAGRLSYVEDIGLPRMLYGKILRSPYAHAKILSINTAEAERLPGVRAVITGRNIPLRKFGSKEREDEFALACEKVRYVGEEVAAVAAEEEDTAEEALSLIKVEYEELPAVFHQEEAMEPGAPLLYEDTKNNIAYTVRHVVGDVNKGFAEADYIREDRFETPMISPAFLGCRGAIADFNPTTGELTLYADCAMPFLGRETTAKILGIPLDKLRVIRPIMPGGFGGKSHLYIDVTLLASFLSMHTGRPVKIIHTRAEEFGTSRGRDPLVTYFKTGVKKNGTLVAMQCRHITNAGAVIDISSATTRQNVGIFDILLRCPNELFEGYVVYTNCIPSATVRGLTNSALNFAQYSHLDMLARDMGIDVADFYLKNAHQKGDVTNSKYRLDSCGLSECIRKVVQVSGWKEKRGRLGKNHGMGLAICGHTCGYRMGKQVRDLSTAVAMINGSGEVIVLSGRAEEGQGAGTMACMIVAEELGVPVEDVKINRIVDTSDTPWDNGNYASRGMLQQGNAVLAASRDAKQQLFEVVAEKLGAKPGDLEAKNGQIFVKGLPDKKIPFKEAAKAYQTSGKQLPLIGRGCYDPPTEDMDLKTGEGNLAMAYGFGAQVAEVEVESETGLVKVLRVIAANDCGKVINPLVLDGESEGGIMMGIGMALLEGICYDAKGHILNASFADYRLPTAQQIPKVDTIWVETIDPHGPYGAKGITEVVTLPTAAAIANAVYDAIGGRIKDLPITPEKVLKALKGKDVSDCI